MSEIQTSNWSETAANNNQTPPNGAPEGMAPSTVNDTMREMMAAIRRWFGRTHGISESEALIASGGTSTAITVTYSNAPASLFTGLEVGFKVTTTCGADPTLNVNALGAKNLQKVVGAGYVNLEAGDIVATQHVKVKYDGTLDKWVLLTGAASSRGPSFFAHKNGTNQTSVANNATTIITWSTESWDTGGYFASDVWTPPAGKYRMTAMVELSGVTDQTGYQITIRKDGAVAASATYRASGTGNHPLIVTGLFSADGTNVFDVRVGSSEATNKTIVGTATSSYFCGEAV